MIAIENNNYLNIDHFTLKFDSHTNLIKIISIYFGLLKEISHTNKFLQFTIAHFEEYIELSKIDSVEKIDEILVLHEEFTDKIIERLEKGEFHQWYLFPLRYMLEKLITSSMSLQSLLGTQQALIMMQLNDSTQNTQV